MTPLTLNQKPKQQPNLLLPPNKANIIHTKAPWMFFFPTPSEKDKGGFPFDLDDFAEKVASKMAQELNAQKIHHLRAQLIRLSRPHLQMQVICLNT